MIKRTVIWIVGILFLLSAASVSAQMTGRQVMEKQKERHKVKTEIGNEDMMLVDKSGAKENRQVVRYAKEVGKDLHRYLVVFLSPGDIRDGLAHLGEKRRRQRPVALSAGAKKGTAHSQGG